MTIIFDSHQHAKRMMEAGMSPALADVQAEVTGELMNELVTLNTKLDTFAVKTESRFQHTDDKVDLVEARMDAKIADAKAELIRWVVGVGILQSSFTAALMLKLMH